MTAKSVLFICAISMSCAIYPKKYISATDKHGFTQINNALDQFF